MEFTLNEVKCLLGQFGGDPDTLITVTEGTEGHSGPGKYAHVTDYPDEGATFLGEEKIPESLEACVRTYSKDSDICLVCRYEMKCIHKLCDPKHGTLRISSQTDSRWNRSWEVTWLATGGMHPKAEKWIEEKTKELGDPPDDLSMSFWKD